ncbi:MAG: hypothetical protein P1P84_07320 [Deferrisomatales bacterium]|nr:hypothetical protein [Deferrisomatales bacterium]
MGLPYAKTDPAGAWCFGARRSPGTLRARRRGAAHPEPLYRDIFAPYDSTDLLYKDYFDAAGVVGKADLAVLATGPVSLAVRDSQGRTTSRTKSEIPGGRYSRADFTDYPGDGILDESLSVPNGAVEGTYEVWALPEPEDRFILEIYVKGASKMLLDGLRIRDIPEEPWAVELRNQPPDASSLSGLAYLVGEEERWPVGTDDYEDRLAGRHPQLRLESGPPGMRLEPDPWTLVWKPTLAQLGNHQVVLVAEVSEGATARTEETIRALLPPVPGFRAWAQDGAVHLSWKRLEGAESYSIYTMERGGLNPVAQGLTSISYVATQVEVGQRYSYQIHGIGRLGGISSHSGWQFVTVAEAEAPSR